MNDLRSQDPEHDALPSATQSSIVNRQSSILNAAGSVGAATMISRVLGVAREMVMAHYFGAGAATDAFNVAFRIPNMLRDLFAEGALSSAFVPTYIRCVTQEGPERACLLANRVLNALAIILGAVTLVLAVGAKWFIYLLASGYAADPEKLGLTVLMTRIMSPFLLCVALASLAMGILNSGGFFFTPAMASSAFNVCCILAGVFLSPLMPRWGLDPVVAMAIGALVGGISQFAVQLPPVAGMGLRYRATLDFSDPALRKIGRLMLPAVVGLSATQINITVDYQLASYYGNGPVSWLNYAFRVMQLPVGIFGAALATVTFARVSHEAARDSLEQLRNTVASSLRLAACLTFPASVGLLLFSNQIVKLLYQRGSFTPEDTLRTGQVVFFFALALFSYSAVKILVPTFYALNDTRTPVRISMLAVAVKVVVNFALVLPFGFLGLAISTVVSSWVNLILLAIAFFRRTDSSFRFHEVAAYLRIGLASTIMGIVALLSFRAIQHRFPGSESTSLGVAILVGISSMVPLLKLFRVREVEEICNLARSVARRIV